MKDRTVKILATSLNAAKNIAKLNKNLVLSSGTWVSSIPEKSNGSVRLKTYSFELRSDY